MSPPQPVPVLPQGELVLLCPSPHDTMVAGAALAPLLSPGDTVLLGGDLGAGKTTFTKGLARALGVAEEVTSPTFVLVHSYPTTAGWDLLHADVWRLSQLQEVIELAIPEAQEDGAVAVVEWGERAAPALAPDHLYVAFSFEPAEEERSSEADGGQGQGQGRAEVPEDPAAQGPGGARRLQFQAFGSGWAARVPALRQLVGQP